MGYTKAGYSFYVDGDKDIILSRRDVELFLSKEDLEEMLEEINKAVKDEKQAHQQ